jgi:hypothetical protein
MITSWKLWQAINHPPIQHPLFNYTVLLKGQQPPRFASGIFIWVLMSAALFFFWSTIFRWMLLALLAMALLLNTLHSLRWSLRISRTIRDEKEQRRFDLLATLPTGMLGSSWAISMGCLHRRGSFQWMPSLVRSLAIAGLLMLTVFGLMTAAVIDNGQMSQVARATNREALHLALLSAGFVLAFYIDHIYSVLNAILIGILAAVRSPGREDAPIRAGLIFLALQLVIYVLSAAVAILVFPWLPNLLPLNSVLAIGVTVAAGLMFFVGLREWLVVRLWQYLIQTHNAERGEVELVLRPANASDDLL